MPILGQKLLLFGENLTMSLATVIMTLHDDGRHLYRVDDAKPSHHSDALGRHPIVIQSIVKWSLVMPPSGLNRRPS